MTNERIAEIRKAVTILSSLTDEDWEKISSVIELEEPAKPSEKAKTDNDKVTDLMLKLGIPANIKGFDYTRSAILYLMNVEDIYMVSVTKELYPEIAKLHKTTASRTERAIRHAADVAWERGDFKIQEEIFGYSINPEKGRPTNSEFVKRLADYFKRK